MQNMLGDALREYTGLRHQLDENLLGENGPIWAEQLKSFLRKQPTWNEVQATELAKPASQQIIQWDDTDLIIPAQPRFVVTEKFTKENQEVKFWDFGSNFLAWFGPMIENEIGETTIRTGKLQVPAKLEDMTLELGEQRILTASQLYWMLLQQPNGEKPNGKNRRLLTNGYANLLRFIDKDGMERAVNAFWFDGYGWRVDADALENVYQWDAGYPVLSCKS